MRDNWTEFLKLRTISNCSPHVVEVISVSWNYVVKGCSVGRIHKVESYHEGFNFVCRELSQ